MASVGGKPVSAGLTMVRVAMLEDEGGVVLDKFCKKKVSTRNENFNSQAVGTCTAGMKVELEGKRAKVSTI